MIGEDDDLYLDGRRAASLGARRERHGDDQLHLRHDRAAQGRADHPPQHLDQRRHLRPARRRHRPRRLPAHAADVPRQRLGDAVRDDRAAACPQVVLRKVDGAEILRRVEKYGVTVMCAAPAVVAAVLDAAPDWEGEIPGRDRTRIIVAGAPPPTKTVARVEAELGWEFIQIYGLTETSPLLTVNRGRQEWDDLERRGARRRSWSAPARPAIGVTPADRPRRGRGAGPLQRRARGLLGAAGGDREGAGRRLVPHRRRRPRSTTTATSRSRTARRT